MIDFKVVKIIVLLHFCGFAIQKPDVLPQNSDLSNLNEYLNQRINQFKLEFHRSFEETRIRRKQKDNFLYSLPERGVLIEEHLKVENASAVFPSHHFGNEAIRVWTVIETIHYTYLFRGYSDGMLIITDFKVNPLKTTFLAQYQEKGNGVPLKSQYFFYDSFIWIVVSFKRKDREYLAVYQYNHNNRTLHRRQTIETDVKCDFDITLKGNTYMAISSYSRKTGGGDIPESTLKLYEWRHTQFDFIAEQKTFRATSVKLFNMAGTLYMAVSQVRYKISNFDNHYPKGSPVFLYNAREDEKLTYVQIIPTHDAIKVEHFRVDGNDYLIFIDTKEDARIYWWAGDQFLHYQDLHDTRFAISVGVVRLPNAEILIAILYTDRVKFFTESVSSKYLLNGQLVVPQPGRFESIQLFSYLQTHYFSLFTFTEIPYYPVSSIWKLTLVNHEVNDNYDHNYDPLRSCLLKLEQTLSQREIHLKEMTQKADRVWLSNSSQNVSANVIIKGKLKIKDLTAKSLLITTNRIVPNITNRLVNERIDSISQSLDKIENKMKDIVYKSTNQTINGRIIFTEGLNAGISRVGNIINRNLLLNGISFNVLADNSLTLNGNQVINAHFWFTNITANNFDIRGLINNLNISDALLADWPHLQVIIGNHKYGDLFIQSDLLLHNQFGSLNSISPSEFVTKSGVNQQISGRKIFQVLEAKNIIVKETTNGADLSDIAHKAVLLNGPNQVITGQLIMESPIQVKRIKLNGLINSLVNVSEIAFNAVTIYGDQKITGQKAFTAPVNVFGLIVMEGNVNGVNLSRDVITTNTKQVITGELTFKSLVEFMNNVECDAINGIDLSREVVRKNITEPQYVSRKVFNESIVVLRDITMDNKSTIDGVDPSELIKLVISNNNVAFEQPISFDILRVNGNIFSQTINHYPINDLPNILWLKSVNQTIEVPVKFEGIVKVRQLSSPNINGFNVPNDFVFKTGSNDVIYGHKKFIQSVFVDGNIQVKSGKRINGIDLNLFERNHVKKDMDSIDYINGPKHFRAIRVEGNIIVGTINGLNISEDIMLTNRHQIINGKIRLSSPLTLISGKLEVMSNINVRANVNNVSLSRFANEIVLTNHLPNSYQRPIRNKLFAGGIEGHHMEAFGTVNGVNIEDMKSRVVTLNTDQQIFSIKNFTGVTKFQNSIISQYLNDLHFLDFVKKVILKDQKTIVRGSKTFAGNVLLKSHLELSGTINGIDVRSLQRRIMSRTRNNIISAPMTFSNNINLGELVLEPIATINGLRASDFALIGNNLRFNGNVVFKSGLTVNGNVEVRKLVNGCDLRRLASEAVFHGSRSSFQSIFGSKQFLNLEVSGNVNINGLLNNIDLNKLSSKMVTKSGNQILRAPLVFEDDVIVENLFVNNLINGRNITFLFKDAVLKNKLQTITGMKTFLNGLIINGSHFEVKGYTNVDGLVNGVDVVKLNQTAVKQNFNQQISGIKTFAGRVVFKRDVTIAGPVSGIKIPNDLILVNTNELIPGLTTFKDWISCEKDLNVKKLIDGIDLLHFIHNRMTLSNGNELITSLLNFKSPVKVDELIVTQTINDIPVNAFITRTGRHLINGIKTFANDVIVSGDLQSPGVYNGIDIHNLVNRAVSIFRPEAISGTTEFTEQISLHQMVITGLLNGYDISDMANFHKIFTAQVEYILDQIKKQVSRQETTLLSQFDSHHFDHSNGFKYFELSQELYEVGERFLINSYRSPIFNIYPTESLLLWTFNPENADNCRVYSTITYKISDTGFMSELSIESGRNIPLINEKYNLTLWTNTTRCGSHSYGKTLMKTIHIDDITSLITKRQLSYDKFASPVIESPFLKDAKLFIDNNHIYVILAENYNHITKSFHTNSTVISLNTKTGHWSQIQEIESFGVHSIDVITYNRRQTIFAAFANRFNTRSNDINSVIMQWNSISQKFEFNTVIKTTNPSAVLFVNSYEGELYVVFANEKTKLFENDCDGNDHNLYTQPINIYRFNSKTFDYFQSIDINGVISLETFIVSNETYIVAASRLLSTTYVIQLRGYNMFEVIQSFSTPYVQNVKSFWSNDGKLHLAIASSKSGHSKIFTAVINGPHNIHKFQNIEHLFHDD